MAPPGFLSLYDNMDITTTTTQSSSSLLLSPFPSFADCMKQITVYSDHNYFFTNNSDNFKNNSDESRTLDTPVIIGDKSCFHLDIPTTTMDNKSGEVMTPVINDDTAVSPGPPALSNGRMAEMDDTDNVLNDVTLVNRLDTPAVSSDTDFLQGLDDLDFDFDDDYEPSREGTLESFIDAALDDTIDVSVDINNNYSNNNNNNYYSNNSQGGVDEEKEEDIYKKEFFFKHLRLQRAASLLPKPTPSTASSSSSSSRKNRKRKHEDSESSNSDQQQQSQKVPLPRPCCLSISTSLHESRLSYHLPPHIINNNSNIHSNNNNNNTIDLSINNNSTTTQSKSSSSSSSHVPHLTVMTPLSVPSKLCSYASSDWKSTILYSTAKSSHVTSVQTSPSTASVSGIPSYHRGFRCESSSETSTTKMSCFPSDIEQTGRLSPSLILSDKAKDCFEFDLLDKNDMDEDTKDLLQWLDNQEVQTTIAGITSSLHSQNPSSASSLSISSRSAGGSESDYNSFSSSSCNNRNNNNVITADDLEAILSPQSQQQSQSQSSSSSWELDRFQDLEAYVLDGSTTTSTSANESHDENQSSNNDVFLESDDVTTAKHHQNQLRLSILSDISRDFLNSEYTENCKTDIFKSSSHSTPHKNDTPSSYSIDSFHQKSKQSSEVVIMSDNSQYWMDSPPLSSPSSSVSSLSSPPHSPSVLHHQESFVHDTTTQSSNNMDLLDLFSDENNAVWCL